MPRLVLVLAGLAIVLSAGLAAELLWPEDVAQPARTVSLAPPSVATARADVDKIPEWVEVILARPLFNIDRRPVAASRTATASAAAVSLPRLAGVMVTSAGRQAIFAGADGGKAVIVAEGGRIGAYTIERIADGAVDVIGPDGKRQIRPSFATGAEATAILPQTPRDGLAAPSASAVNGLDLLRLPLNTSPPAARRQ